MPETVTDIVCRDFNITAKELMSEAELEELLAARILQLLDANPEQLFAALYRLDVDERLVHAAMLGTTETPANIAIAKLVIKRQMEKAESRRRYAQEDEGDGSW